MNFNFPTMESKPLVELNYTKIQLSKVQSNFEEKLKKVFKESKASNKFYLVHFTEEFIKAEEFSHESYFISNIDLLAELYYDPLFNPVISYSKLSKVKFSHHLENLKNY